MSKFVLTYHGTPAEMSSDPDEFKAEMDAWGAWYGSIGANLVDGGAPFSTQAGIAADGSDMDAPAALTGYTVVDVDSLDAAKAIAKGCPVLAHGSTVQISECIDMG